MSFHYESTVAGYARAAVDLRTRMIEYTRTPSREPSWSHSWTTATAAAPS